MFSLSNSCMCNCLYMVPVSGTLVPLHFCCMTYKILPCVYTSCPITCSVCLSPEGESSWSEQGQLRPHGSFTSGMVE